MPRVLAIALALALVSAPVLAGSPQTVVNALADEARRGSCDLALLDTPSFEDLPIAARLTMFAGVDASVSFLTLGDKSPLKQAVGEQAWERLLQQGPRLAAAADAMRQSLTATALAELEGKQFGLVKTATFAAGGMVLAAGRIEDKLQQGTLIFSARAVLSAVRDGRITRKLGLMAIDPRLPAEVRKEAATALALATGVEVQQTLAEAKYVSSLE